MKWFHIISIFPDMFGAYVNDSILGRAQKNKYIEISIIDPRAFSKDKHKKVDDKPYGGGPGMVMSVEPIVRAVASVQKKIQKRKNAQAKVILFTPGGKIFDNKMAKKFAKAGKNDPTDYILICGRYEGIDARVRKILRATEISIGDFVLTGGELPAMILIDAVSRQIPGVLGNEESPEELRTASHDMYTRPETFTWQGKEYKVPKVLTSGDHKKIEEWRRNH